MKKILLSLLFVASFFVADAQKRRTQQQFQYRVIQSEAATLAAPVNSALPAVLGTDVVGSTLTCSTGTWANTPTSYTYRWLRDGVAISGETASTYVSVTGDSYYGVAITCGVTAINATGSSAEAESADFEVVVNPTTITARYYSADVSFKNTSKTTPAVDGEGVQTIEDQVGDVDLDWIGTITGKVQLQGTDVYGDTDPYPRYHSEDGGFIRISNSEPQKFETASISYTGEITTYEFYRLAGGTDNEYWNFVSNRVGSMRDRDSGTGNSTQLGGTNSLVTWSPADRLYPDIVYKKNMMATHRTAAGNAQFYLNRTARGPVTAIGTNTMTEFAIGSNSHNANLDYFAGAVVNAAYSATTAGQLQKLWEKKHGDVGTYSEDYPMITFDNGSAWNDQETWTTGDKSWNAPSHTFRSPIGAAEGATEVRFYTSTSSVQATAIANRTYVGTKVVGVDANPYKWIRNVDFNVGLGTSPTNVYVWMEVTAVDEFGNRQPIPTQTQGANDSQN
jgi:hypothetical protein